MGKLSRGCWDTLWWVRGDSLEGVQRVWGGCLKVVGRLSGGSVRLSGWCEEAVWRVWGDCL